MQKPPIPKRTSVHSPLPFPLLPTKSHPNLKCSSVNTTQRSITYDPTNPLLHTNLAMALLKLSQWARVITASTASIALLPENMKAYYYLAQAQIALHDSADAVKNARRAHALCVKEIEGGGKGGASLGVISQLVMRCLKEDWERREEARLRGLEGTLKGVVGALERERDGKIAGLGSGDVDVEGEVSEEGIREEYEGLIAEVTATFEAAGKVERKKVPDWDIDAIQFGVMLDPVVVYPPFIAPHLPFIPLHMHMHKQPLTKLPNRQKPETPTNAPPSWSTSNEAPPTP